MMRGSVPSLGYHLRSVQEETMRRPTEAEPEKGQVPHAGTIPSREPPPYWLESRLGDSTTELWH